jgi:hypothetical protein
MYSTDVVAAGLNKTGAGYPDLLRDMAIRVFLLRSFMLH